MSSPEDMRWIEHSDFTGGLWARNSERECPENGLLEATDCYPQPRGGIRAFMKMQHVHHGGLPANSLILGVWHVCPPFPQGNLYLALLQLNTGTHNGSATHTLRVYRKDVSSLANINSEDWGAGTATSRQVFSQAGVAKIDTGMQLMPYRIEPGQGAGVADGYRPYFSLAWVSTASTGLTTFGGIYRIGTSSNASTDLGSSSPGSTRVIETTNAGPGCFTVHQARLMYTEVTNQLHNRILYTSQGRANQPGGNDFNEPLGERAGAITFLEPVPPSDMTIAKNQMGLILAQGDTLNPAFRQMTYSHHFLQSFPVTTDEGLFYMVVDDGCYIFSAQGQLPITPNFYGTPMNPGFYPATFSTINSNAIKVAQPAIAGNFLFAGNGYVMDMRTKAWFRSSFIPKSKNHTADVTGSNNTGFRVFASENAVYTGANKVLHWGYYNETTGEGTWDPASEYSFTLPLVFLPYQQVSLRQVELHVESFNPKSKVTIEVTKPGPDGPETSQPQTRELTKVGPQPIRFNVGNAHADWFKVRVTCTAGQGTNVPAEAPMVERLLLGTIQGVRYRADA